MRALTAAALVACLLFSSGAQAAQRNLPAEFEAFKIKFGRKYASKEEEASRFHTFVENMREAERMQALNPLARFGVNDMADWTKTEFQVRHNAAASLRSTVRDLQSRTPPVADPKLRATMNQTVDWRAAGAVTPIKNQLACGGCWSFSTTGNIEGQWFLAGNPLTSLSEQDLLSCDSTCNGCHGGNMVLAFEWLVSARGGAIATEASYPFVSGDGNLPACASSGKTIGAYITGNVVLPHNEQDMAAWVSTNGPASIAVDSTSFQTYTGGILTNCVGNQVDHAVLIVGYNMVSNPPYWIIKNQWGTTWGEDGYMYLEFGQNECLITTLPCSSTVGSNPPPVPTPNPNGPPPPPPPPPAGANFTQYTCPDNTCQDGCQGTTLPTGQCLQSGNTTAMATCGNTYLHLQVFNSSDCSGPSQEEEIPLDQCSQDSTGSYIYDTCGSTSELMKKNAKLVRRHRN